MKMPRRIPAATACTALAAALGLSAPAAVADTAPPLLAHDYAPCVLAGGPARLEARVPAEHTVRSAQVHFRGAGQGAWYTTPLREEAGVWRGALPSASTELGRLSYFITLGLEGTTWRLPAEGTFMVDVVAAPCAEGTLPGGEAPESIGVPAGEPRTPPGFDLKGVRFFTEAPAAAASAPAPEPVLPVLSAGARVRLTTVGGQRHEGTVLSAAAGRLRLAGGGVPTDLPLASVARLEVGKPRGLGLVGALAGAAGGFALGILVCATGDVCSSLAPMWLGTFGGAIAGGAAGGSVEWQAVPLRPAAAQRGLPAGDQRVGTQFTVRF